ncbi:aldehyde dehydrogenase family protein [Nonomuraea muscovyensis]|uniref:Acyl-CoA reductase-like NAD-dependent aldehyde dehydrogenase n=1 Tax=Nonomuraea muscovyensis TaxID=1124761 RepID=A0A7X0C5T8_9ACTN|nr:aldehyde dehydrogenase family protein [Nonomuraea muscovyensis]MBB6349077.1 acyl-CoA reductase-like NAD-dependent aldehyde dehydrogenase [Nonomuraea muscovyensis]
MDGLVRREREDVVTPVLDPLTGRVERPLAPVSPDRLAATAAALRAMAPAWTGAPASPEGRAVGWERRAAALTRFGAAVARDEELAAALVADTGRVAESLLETRAVAALVARWVRQAPALLAPPPERPASLPGGPGAPPHPAEPQVVVAGDVVPYELVGVIGPWNFPLLLSLIDAVPALAAGCTVLVKPSEVTPRFIEPLMRLVPEELPLRVVEGDGTTGAALVDLVDAVVFTGSVPTGSQVARAAARAFVPAFLEMGGKDPAIVLAGADLDRAASAILWGGTANAGQSCQSIERVYVARTVYEEFLALLARKAAGVRLTCEGGPIGPIIEPRQADVIAAHLADAAARGAVTHTGGRIERHGGGHWCRPTVLSEVDHSMLVMTEETFGPVLPVMAVDGPGEAVALANDSVYGLSAAVFAGSEEEALAVAARLRAGAISVNDASLTAFVHDGEKHAFGRSGLGGSRMGAASIARFLRRRAFLVNRSTAADPWWHTSEE